MPTPRSELVAEVANGALYAIGGHSGTSLTSVNEFYVP